ncbi:MAG: carbohydrate porin [Rhabdochlamydiaceae bacterium]|nr:carbohydrate porin [Rhabdochlamydiaceae bacterium]
MTYKKQILLFLLTLSPFVGFAEDATVKTSPPLSKIPKEREPPSKLGMSTNPSTVNITTGTGDLGKYIFRIPENSPLTVGGVLISDGDVVFAGGNKEFSPWSGNNLLILDASLDFEKLIKIKGGLLGAEFLQFNGMNSNATAGSLQGFDSMSVLPPFDRSELYQLWYRQSLFDDLLIIRIGKTVPTLDFNNVSQPIPVQDLSRAIPSVSGLLYTPIFINPVNIGVMPGYYNSAYGITVNVSPVKNFYVTGGVYDGNLARGKQLGLTGPHFNGYYFSAYETGVNWLAGQEKKPGIMAIGAWFQTGKLSIPGVVTQQGAQGTYLFGSQRVWFHKPGIDNSGISVFWQLGYNHAKTLPMNQFLGGGFTAFALTRPFDSFGMGLACSRLNHRIFSQKFEVMIQAYYQAHLFLQTYLEPVITYIPNPGAAPHLPQTWTATLQMINLF